MPATPGNLAVVPQFTPGQNPYNGAAYVSARVLAANTAETITVPTNATKVRLAGTADFYIAYSGAASVPVDTDDGTACELIKVNADPEWRTVQGLTSLSVISAGVAIVTASFFTN